MVLKLLFVSIIAVENAGINCGDIIWYKYKTNPQRQSGIFFFTLFLFTQETKQFSFGLNGERCLTCNAETKEVYVETFNQTLETQKWSVDSIDEERLKKWKETEPFL